MEDGPGILGGASHSSRKFRMSWLLGHPLQFSSWTDSMHPFGVCISFPGERHPHYPLLALLCGVKDEVWGFLEFAVSQHTRQAAQSSLLAACIHDGDLKARGLLLFPVPERVRSPGCFSGTDLLSLCHQKCPHRYYLRMNTTQNPVETQRIQKPQEVHLVVLSGGDNPVRSASSSGWERWSSENGESLVLHTDRCNGRLRWGPG